MTGAIIANLKKKINKEICICAAILTSEGRIIRGQRHSNCIMTMQYMTLKQKEHEVEQGFVTSKNRFVTREEGQILQKAAKIKSIDPSGYRGNRLYSEDLY